MEELRKIIQEKEKNICQITCYKNNKLVYSDCFNGYKQNDACHVMSVTKSVVSLLIGILIDKHLINSIDDFVLDYFPDYNIKRGEKTIKQITIKHLLTMSAPYKYKYEPWVKVCTSDDWTVAALDLLGGRKGLSNEFFYSTLGIHILCGIISKVTKMPTVEFANEFLFKPLGITPHENLCVETAEEHKEFTMSKLPKRHVWFCDPMGVGCAGYGLCFSSDDLAKIGLLCLNDGKYNDIQIVSSEWLKKSFHVYHYLEDYRKMMYGFLWWIIDVDKEIYAAIGNSGNVIYIDKSNNFVCSVTAYFKPTIFDRVDFIKDVIEPYFLNKTYD